MVAETAALTHPVRQLPEWQPGRVDKNMFSKIKIKQKIDFFDLNQIFYLNQITVFNS